MVWWWGPTPCLVSSAIRQIQEWRCLHCVDRLAWTADSRAGCQGDGQLIGRQAVFRGGHGGSGLTMRGCGLVCTLTLSTGTMRRWIRVRAQTSKWVHNTSLLAVPRVGRISQWLHNRYLLGLPKVGISKCLRTVPSFGWGWKKRRRDGTM